MISNPTKTQLISMKVHQTAEINYTIQGTAWVQDVLRVPNGWIYSLGQFAYGPESTSTRMTVTSTFVPEVN
jgi:hypothetical protein